MRAPRPSRPTASSTAATRAASGRPSSSSGSATFSATLRCGSTWKAWNTKPSFARRKRARSSSPSDSHVLVGQAQRAAVGRSSPAMQFSSVDLPTPDSPISATNSPRATSSDTSWNTGVAPKALDRERSCSMGWA